MQKSHTVRSSLCKIFRKGKSMSTEIKSWLPGARNEWMGMGRDHEDTRDYFRGNANVLSQDVQVKLVSFMLCIIPQ